jgi:acetyl-CoA decarbonylase/synthase complex subunit delta
LEITSEDVDADLVDFFVVRPKDDFEDFASIKKKKIWILPEQARHMFELVGENVKGDIIGPVTSDNNPKDLARIIGRENKVLASTKLDPPSQLALNEMLIQVIDQEKIVVDPLTTIIGYGIEYTYSTIERIVLEGLQNRGYFPPIYVNVSKAWEIREAQNQEKAVDFEVGSAIACAMAGASLIAFKSIVSLEKAKEVIDETVSI